MPMRDDPYAADHEFDVAADHEAHRVRELHLRNNLLIETGWEIRERVFDPDMVVSTGSNYMTGNATSGTGGPSRSGAESSTWAASSRIPMTTPTAGGRSCARCRTRCGPRGTRAISRWP